MNHERTSLHSGSIEFMLKIPLKASVIIIYQVNPLLVLLLTFILFFLVINIILKHSSIVLLLINTGYPNKHDNVVFFCNLYNMDAIRWTMFIGPPCFKQFSVI